MRPPEIIYFCRFRWKRAWNKNCAYLALKIQNFLCKEYGSPKYTFFYDKKGCSLAIPISHWGPMLIFQSNGTDSTKIIESGSMCGCTCMYVCPAMRFVMLWDIELKLGMVVGDGPMRCVGIFSKQPHLGSKVLQGSICLRNCPMLWLPNLVRRASDQSVVHCLGQSSRRGHLGSTRGQVA